MYKKSKKEIVLENLPLVKKVASKIYKRLPDNTLEFEELVNVGVIGLIKAIDKYDENKAKFSTYAYIKIRGEILDFLRKLDFVSRGVREKIKNGEIEDIKGEAAVFLSIEEALFGDDSTLTLGDTLASADDSPEDIVVLKDLKEALAKAISQLNDNEKLVLQLLFVEEFDLKSAAEVMGVSVSRVSQIKKAALLKLREYLKDSV
ncbi:RNA polymerase, sigma 28 subunit, SigD/FliA/WhiG [Desulfurobacterium pacificum]|uniref:RNA polymerase, sigma 28 subunit, SigD/FliA/WhiG n=1 Tax=Desulfurobacterium pacificum TaxID=240166 RepID=A0ABY1NMR1_9BACT|nr:sigma-70 family RNA polymerase sigma factor [Desulfurobacterium pacificum]SMP13761.1 RNA polymerase, sigma 28 subunit, SigD/FliA/WhiG [Desulfurobacterium pacificum]